MKYVMLVEIADEILGVIGDYSIEAAAREVNDNLMDSRIRVRPLSEEIAC